ncbi:MAG: GyrI-like domain-containing protein [Flavobacteriaceae bacterium]
MKIVTWGLLIAILGTLIWYFFIKEYDYQINFEVKTTTGTVNQSIKSWNSSHENPQPIQQISEKELIQKITIKDSSFTYLWNISPKNDSILKVTAYISDAKNRFKNRITIPFYETDFEKTSKRVTEELFNKLNNHLKEIKVKIEGKENSPSNYAAYVSLKTHQIEKAKGMMENFNLLSSFVADNYLEPSGQPFLEITSWNKTTDSLSFNFCFPFKKPDSVYIDSLTINSKISIKQFPSKKALKAIYNGNYITSDRAWYALEDYAKKNNIPVEMFPIEVFYNNPNMGGDEHNWKTEVYLPLKKE